MGLEKLGLEKFRNGIVSGYTTDTPDIRKDTGVCENICETITDEWKIEEEYESLIDSIETMIKDSFLMKEYYPNLPDWSNPEIDGMSLLSPFEIKNRLKENKWIFFMRSCIPQTLYSINNIKENFPKLSKFINLCAEIYKDVNRGIFGLHFFISINIPNKNPLIIDYAHDNDVYIYSWEYSNKSIHVNTEPLKLIHVSATIFNEEDNIITIAEKLNKELSILKSLWIDPFGVLPNNENLKEDNTYENFVNRWNRTWINWVVVHCDGLH